MNVMCHKPFKKINNKTGVKLGESNNGYVNRFKCLRLWGLRFNTLHYHKRELSSALVK